MDTAFKTGDIVVARESVQGLIKDRSYEVVSVVEQPTPRGTVVTYNVVLHPIDLSRWVRSIPVVNGHLLLEPAHTIRKSIPATSGAIRHALYGNAAPLLTKRGGAA